MPSSSSPSSAYNKKPKLAFVPPPQSEENDLDLSGDELSLEKDPKLEGKKQTKSLLPSVLSSDYDGNNEDENNLKAAPKPKKITPSAAVPSPSFAA
jgi:hypothetical protein